ncbi:MAG TPA: hypothetical protein VHB46_20735 [Burkholderiales bacterium]|nr:hypothetical protein [Burkholderiales bacterium]
MQTATLFIPSLFWPATAAAADSPGVPALQLLIGRGNALESLPCEDEAAWLCNRFGVARQADWPSAPVSALGTGIAPENAFWLHADPVHLRVQRDQLVLIAPEALAIGEAEAASMCATLNRHFESDGLSFAAPHPLRWFVRSAKPARMQTNGLTTMAGRDIDRLLPKGEDAMAWHKMFNEVQMLLHEHPVNEERERRGVLPVNSLWFSGGGSLPQARSPYQAVVGSSALARGLAKLTQTPFISSTSGVDTLESGNLQAQDVLIELGDAAEPWLRHDHDAWKSALESLDQRWFAPLVRLLKIGRLRRLDIATVAGGQARQWSVTRAHLWRWWRGAVPLTEAAQTS